MKLTSKEFLWVQFIFLCLLIATMDMIVRGPMLEVKRQMDHLTWLRQATSCDGIERLNNEVYELRLEIYELKRGGGR